MIARIVVHSDKEMRRQHWEELLTKEGLHIEHPDLLFIDSDQKLGIELARMVKDHFLMRPYQAKGRGVVIEDLSGITIDAQNALLKVLEEPPEEAVIIFGTSSLNHLLPTFLSRCQVITLEGSSEISGSKTKEEIEEILGKGRVERFKFVEKLDDKEAFLQKLLVYIEQKLIDKPEYIHFAKELLLMEQWQKAHVNARGILEYLMLILPKNA